MIYVPLNRIQAYNSHAIILDMRYPIPMLYVLMDGRCDDEAFACFYNRWTESAMPLLDTIALYAVNCFGETYKYECISRHWLAPS